jgi:hypothetical protein
MKPAQRMGSHGSLSVDTLLLSKCIKGSW